MLGEGGCSLGVEWRGGLCQDRVPTPLLETSSVLGTFCALASLPQSRSLVRVAVIFRHGGERDFALAGISRRKPFPSLNPRGLPVG